MLKTFSEQAIVYIWSTTDTNPGHASLGVRDHYISYWPTVEDSDMKDGLKNPPGKGNLKDFKLGTTHKVNFPSSYKVDCRLERKEANFIIPIRGLKTEKMCEQWQDFKANPKRYNMQKRNCSTVVASFLELGSGIPYKKTPCIHINNYVQDAKARFFFKMRFMGHTIEMWTPHDVHLYALQIKSAKGQA